MTKKHDIRIERPKLHPWLDVKLGKLLDACAKEGIYLIITEGFRSVARQNALYAQGRTKPGNIVTNARGTSYSSQHMWGVAVDFAINDKKLLYNSKYMQKVANIAKKLGFGWGGDWKSFKDTPHLYLKKWGDTTSKLKAQYGTPEKFASTWRKKVSRREGLVFYKDEKKKAGYCRVAYGKSVEVLYTKSWYARVRYKGKVGYMNKKYLK